MKKEFIRLLFVIVLLIGLSLSATYAYMRLSDDANTATGEAGCFEVDYTGQTINSSSIKSVLEDYIDRDYNGELLSTEKEYEGKSEITLSKDENCKIYTEASIYLHTDSINNMVPLCGDENDINGNGKVDAGVEKKYEEAACSMKYKIMQGSTQVSSGVISSPDVTNSSEQLFLTVDLTETETTYTVYIWIERSTSLGYYDSRAYSGYLYATSSQTSTITQ